MRQLDHDKGKLKKDLGLFATIAIIIGQMIGSGIYMAPQGLAELANPKVAVLAMLITGVGTLLLALSFAKLGNRKAATGSAIVYTQEAFGDLPAFWVGWSYWCGCWIGNGAIVLVGISYASYFFPFLANVGFSKFLAAILIIWLFTLINIFGVKKAGYINLILTALKLIPLVVFIFIAAYHFKGQNFQTVSSPDVSGLFTLPIAIAYTLWSFLGFEGAGVNAGEVKNSKQIGMTTIISTAIVVIIYLLLVILAAGNMPQDQLAQSASPFADIIHNATGGYWAGAFISLGGSIATIGCVGAWILSTARISYSLGERHLLPVTFAEINPKYGTPVKGLIINAVLMTLVMILGLLTHESGLYNFLVLLSVMSFLVFYAFGAASEIVLSGREIRLFNFVNFVKLSVLSLLALAYAIYTIFSSGAEYVRYGFLLMLIGLPIYIYLQLKKSKV